MGAPKLEEFITVDASRTGMLLKPYEKAIPFQDGTIIELEIPLERITATKQTFVTFLGKVVRVETENLRGKEHKSCVGVKLIQLNPNDEELWETIFHFLENSYNTRAPSPLEESVLIPPKVA